MITLQKTPGRDFILLNLTDIHLNCEEWAAGHPKSLSFAGTAKALVERVHPDLITVSGDIWGKGDAIQTYTVFADFMDSLQIPWAVVWGNHDNEAPKEVQNAASDLFAHSKFGLFEKGDPELGCGNYVIAIREGTQTVEGILMMDTHCKHYIPKEDGSSQLVWDSLTDLQLQWYREQIDTLKALGCNDTSLILHIPIYGYRSAANAALKDGLSTRMDPAEPDHSHRWNEDFADSFGLMDDNIASPLFEDGVQACLEELGSTRHILCGHCHTNSTVIRYHGIRHMFSTKTGTGGYGIPDFNGGTCLRITSHGVTEVWHEHVDIHTIAGCTENA